MSECHTFGKSKYTVPVTCHAWNKDCTEIALSPNNNEIDIYKRAGAEWKLIDTLNQHDLRVTAIDWAKNANRIVTCSVDRNAYVWTKTDDGKWKPTLVLLRINRAATCVKWSPKENKFAVGSGARLISICYFESENDWWVSKHIKKPIRSTITCLDWHQNNVLLAAGSTDYKARVFSAYIKDIEEQPASTPWGNKMPFGQLMAEFKNSMAGGGWVNSVSFSSDGSKLCWVGHDATINVVDASNVSQVIKLKTELLPFLCCEWITSNAIVVAGHSYAPFIYTFAGGTIKQSVKLDQSQKKENAVQSARQKFVSIERTNQSENTDTTVNSIHQNAIISLRIYTGDKASAKKVSTTGGDGQLVIWDIPKI